MEPRATRRRTLEHQQAVASLAAAVLGNSDIFRLILPMLPFGSFVALRAACSSVHGAAQDVCGELVGVLERAAALYVSPRYIEALQLVSEHQPHLAWLIQTPALAVVTADRYEDVVTGAYHLLQARAAPTAREPCASRAGAVFPTWPLCHRHRCDTLPLATRAGAPDEGAEARRLARAKTSCHKAEFDSAAPVHAAAHGGAPRCVARHAGIPPQAARRTASSIPRSSRSTRRLAPRSPASSLICARQVRLGMFTESPRQLTDLHRAAEDAVSVPPCFLCFPPLASHPAALLAMRPARPHPVRYAPTLAFTPSTRTSESGRCEASPPPSAASASRRPRRPPRTTRWLGSTRTTTGARSWVTRSRRRSATSIRRSRSSANSSADCTYRRFARSSSSRRRAHARGIYRGESRP